MELKQSFLIKQMPHGVGLPLPSYATAQSAGMDLYAAVEEAQPIILEVGARALIPTGVQLVLMPGYEAQIRPRSGLAWQHGVTVLNAPGTIDADYRGEVSVLLINLGKESFLIERGQRIAQMLVSPVVHVIWQVADDLDSYATHRQAGGFGSTGVF